MYAMVIIIVVFDEKKRKYVFYTITRNKQENVSLTILGILYRNPCETREVCANVLTEKSAQFIDP